MSETTCLSCLCGAMMMSKPKRRKLRPRYDVHIFLGCCFFKRFIYFKIAQKRVMSGCSWTHSKQNTHKVIEKKHFKTITNQTKPIQIVPWWWLPNSPLFNNNNNSAIGLCVECTANANYVRFFIELACVLLSFFLLLLFVFGYECKRVHMIGLLDAIGCIWMLIFCHIKKGVLINFSVCLLIVEAFAFRFMSSLYLSEIKYFLFQNKCHIYTKQSNESWDFIDQNWIYSMISMMLRIRCVITSHILIECQKKHLFRTRIGIGNCVYK